MLVEFIIPTYDRKFPLASLLASLLAQTNENWKATVIQDGIDGDYCFKLIREIGDKRISVYSTPKRYNDWGHSLREIGKQNSKADYVIMTGDDNYYMPTLVQELKNATINQPGMVYWDMVHSHYNYQYFKCTPAYNQIDMGAFATRTDLAKQIKLNTSYAADGEFVRDFNAKFPFEKKVKIEKVLFVHN
jgi:glycosyltransferase involved in cell wall biosynthesis